MSFFEEITAAGGLLTDLTVSKSDKERGVSVKKIKLDGILDPCDAHDPRRVCRAVAASQGGVLNEGDVSAKGDGLTAAIAYDRLASVGLDVVDLADVAIGGAARDRIISETAETNKLAREQREKLEAQVAESRASQPETVKA